MASDINTAIPPFGNPTTAGIRNNFTAAKAEIEELQTSCGYADYNDLQTQTTPISVSSGTWTKLTNDTLGPNTKLGKLPSGVSAIWNPVSNQFDFASVPVDSMMNGRFDFAVTTTAANQTVDLSAFVAIGSASAFELPLMTSMVFKTTGEHKITVYSGMYIGSEDMRENPTEIKIRSDSTCSVKVNGWYVQVFKKL